jgi:tetrahydromethanopterin S-methyltransferase subunit C
VAVVEQPLLVAQIIGEYLAVLQAQTVQVQAVDKFQILLEQTAAMAAMEFQVAVVECQQHQVHKQTQAVMAVQV